MALTVLFCVSVSVRAVSVEALTEASPAAQSSGRVNGTIRDENGDVLIGAFVYVKGTRNGVTTNMVNNPNYD